MLIGGVGMIPGYCGSGDIDSGLCGVCGIIM